MPRIYHVDKTLPDSRQIFVFGSNLSGIHGAGAALVAKKFYGARQWRGQGHMGRSYAIPTRNGNMQTLGVSHIQDHIRYFCLFTHRYPDWSFFVTRVGCGLAGLKDRDIAPFFSDANENCSFAEEWRDYLG